jgi:DNA-binding SARP family transcriptional activator
MPDAPHIQPHRGRYHPDVGEDLRVRLLGGLEVVGRTPAEVGSRKARTLVAALAVARGAPRSVEALVEVVWGDAVPARAGDQLGVLVSRLRGVLGADRITRTDAGLRLHTSWLDLDDLDAHAARASARLRAGDPLAARLAATMALDLARGPLLPEQEGEWVEGPRAAAARAVAAVRLVAAEAALAVGDPAGAAAAAGAGLDADPYDEAALRALMRAHVVAGRPASALAAYAAVRERLAEDLGVSPTSETEALHDAVVLDPASVAAVAPAPPAPSTPRGDRFDPLVHRARAELAGLDFDAASRDAEEAVRRGGGAVASEVAGWVAYYRRDFPTALAHAEAGAVAAQEEERRASCLTLAGRVRHSQGDLAIADAPRTEAAACSAPGVRAVAEVWLGGLRTHQGRPAEAVELAERGAVDDAAVRHPFVIPWAFFSLAYGLGQQGEVAAAVDAVDRWDQALDGLGAAGERYRAAAANFRGWLLLAVGRPAEAAAQHRVGLVIGTTSAEPRTHAALDLAAVAIARHELSEATRLLEEIVVPPDDAGSMAWHLRHRLHLLRGEVALLEGRVDEADEHAGAVITDATSRGAPRPRLQAELLALRVRGGRGQDVPVAAGEDVLRGLDEVAGLDVWRAAASLALASGHEPWWNRAVSEAAALVERSGPLAGDVRAWTDTELARLRSSA